MSLFRIVVALIFNFLRVVTLRSMIIIVGVLISLFIIGNAICNKSRGANNKLNRPRTLVDIASQKITLKIRNNTVLV